ncbi:MAG: PQQ-dependent sugar dehydrogenase [Gemmatimonadales bacterium]
MKRLLIVLAVSAACNSSSDSSGPPEIPVSFGLAAQPVATGLSNPVYLTSPPADARLFVVEQGGRIKIIENGTVLPTPFLDISSRISTGGERGLLSVAFHPSYKTNGFFFVYFTATNGDIRVDRYSVSANRDVANASSSKLIITAPHSSAANHNGGLATFGPDGKLYLGLGDGGGGGDPFGNSQNKGTLLASILRIDVDGDPYSIPPGNPFIGVAGAKEELWAIGLRNPWRYTFDRMTGLLYIADVGQGKFEEVDVVPATQAGVNYGWNVMEGLSCYNATACDQTGFQLPVIDYSHSDGSCSITGGFVYRGSALPEIAGHYFYSDYCLGFLKSFRYANGAVADAQTWPVGSLGSVTSFGEDAAGELYVLSSNGRVYKLVRGS